ncbi:CoA-dependent acyltransferase, partial [Setomelanomma holmii]
GSALSRTAIVKSGAHRYFVWTTHHSVYDGWSFAKTMELLTGLLRGQPLSVSVPVSRFIAYLSRQDKDQTAAFWQKHLQGANWTRYPALPSPQQPVNPRDTLRSHLQVPLAMSSVTTSTVLRAAWALLVAAHTGVNEAVVNVVLSGRMAPVEGITDLIAPTITTVPFRVSTSPDQSVCEFLAEVHDRATEMIPYEHSGLRNIRRMVPGLGSDFDPGHIFVVQPAGEAESGTPMLDMKVEHAPSSMDAFDAYALTVECTVEQMTREVSVELRYDNAVIPDDNARRLLSQFRYIVQKLAQDTEASKPLGQLSLLSAEDDEQFRRWNSTMPPRVERCVHDLVLDKMATQPTAPAISAWDGEMTYGQLENASRQLA